MFLEALKIGISIVQWACMFGLALYTFMSNRSAARTKEVNDVSDRVLVLEERIRHMPSKELVQELEGDINAIRAGLQGDMQAIRADLQGEMKSIRAELVGLRGELSPMNVSLNRINDFLLNNK